MKFKFNIRREIKITVALIVLFFFIGFSERKQRLVAVTDVIIRIDNVEGNHFVDEKDIMKLMDLNLENLKGASLNNVDLRQVEKRIKSDPFIHDAELYSDLKGNLVIKALLRRPVARLVRNDGPDAYIAEDGTVMPVTDKFTTRVVLISGGYVRQLLHQKNVQETEDGKQLMEMLEIIRENDFWAAQIAQLDIDGRSRVTVYPQVGGEIIEFGRLENLEEKFKKLKIYYKEILPEMGWNKYKRVNLEFEKQIIAE